MEQKLFDELKKYLTELGWNFKEISIGENLGVAAPIITEANRQILLSFKISGEFVIVSTVDLLKNVPITFANKLLELNDTLKGVKVFAIPEESTEKTQNIELGFELWDTAWSKDSLGAFLDLTSFGVDKVLLFADEHKISNNTK